MQIDYNNQTQTIKIKDDLKFQYQIIKAMLFLLIANAIIFIFTASKTGFGTLDYVWIVLGLISAVVLYQLYFKKSTAQEIAIKDIKQLKIRTIRGKSHYALELLNGKVRNLAVFSNDKDEKKLLQLCNKAGIKKG
jgi:hypothetical protein